MKKHPEDKSFALYFEDKMPDAIMQKISKRTNILISFTAMTYILQNRGSSLSIISFVTNTN